MEPIYYVLAIMGCGDGGTACAESRVEAPRYESIQACQAAVPAALMRNTDMDFPTVAAACRANAPRMVEKVAPPLPRG